MHVEYAAFPSKWAWSCPSCMVGAELEIEGSVYLIINACGVSCISAVELFTGILSTYD